MDMSMVINKPTPRHNFASVYTGAENYAPQDGIEEFKEPRRGGFSIGDSGTPSSRLETTRDRVQFSDLDGADLSVRTWKSGHGETILEVTDPASAVKVGFDLGRLEQDCKDTDLTGDKNVRSVSVGYSQPESGSSASGLLVEFEMGDGKSTSTLFAGGRMFGQSVP